MYKIFYCCGHKVSWSKFLSTFMFDLTLATPEKFIALLKTLIWPILKKLLKLFIFFSNNSIVKKIDMVKHPQVMPYHQFWLIRQSSKFYYLIVGCDVWEHEIFVDSSLICRKISIIIISPIPWSQKSFLYQVLQRLLQVPGLSGISRLKQLVSSFQ